jgi:hypothetical protein
VLIDIAGCPEDVEKRGIAQRIVKPRLVSWFYYRSCRLGKSDLKKSVIWESEVGKVAKLCKMAKETEMLGREAREEIR